MAPWVFTCVTTVQVKLGNASSLQECSFLVTSFLCPTITVPHCYSTIHWKGCPFITEFLLHVCQKSISPVYGVRFPDTPVCFFHVYLDDSVTLPITVFPSLEGRQTLPFYSPLSKLLWVLQASCVSMWFLKWASQFLPWDLLGFDWGCVECTEWRNWHSLGIELSDLWIGQVFPFSSPLISAKFVGDCSV